VSYAGRLGLDVERFAGDLEACLGAKRIAAAGAAPLTSRR
jgi:hypothetical protein